MAIRRKIRVNQYPYEDNKGVRKYKYVVMSLTNTLVPHIGETLGESEVRALMRKADMDVTIRADKIVR